MQPITVYFSLCPSCVSVLAHNLAGATVLFIQSLIQGEKVSWSYITLGSDAVSHHNTWTFPSRINTHKVALKCHFIPVGHKAVAFKWIRWVTVLITALKIDEKSILVDYRKEKKGNIVLLCTGCCKYPFQFHSNCSISSESAEMLSYS